MAHKKTVWLGWTAGVEERRGERVGWSAHVFRLNFFLFFLFWVRTMREGGIHRYVPEGSGWKPALPLRL